MENNDCSDNKVKLYSTSGKEFIMKGTLLEDSKDLTVVKPGYIITREGSFIHIDQHDCHSDIMNEYLSNYLEIGEVNLNITKGISKLNEIGHVVYLGLRTNEDSYRSCSVDSLIWHPGFDKLTKQQLEAIDIILENNMTCTRREMFNIMFGNYSEGCETCIPINIAREYLETSKSSQK